MPHATEPHDVEADRDQALIERVLDPQNTELDWTRELEPGEKADDAVDFEDIGGDDLADDRRPHVEEFERRPFGCGSVQR